MCIIVDHGGCVYFTWHTLLHSNAYFLPLFRALAFYVLARKKRELCLRCEVGAWSVGWGWDHWVSCTTPVTFSSSHLMSKVMQVHSHLKYMFIRLVRNEDFVF
eukprot:TRINITY_DN83508_c0_g1_i1.p3 TRINITY_DN83508_c0_g1~~TRINITY_DN83508_c0_g1_i1.p3  ORF type:complete len:103 (+),score=1.26 TRINITY_DN83508_c0_g1_i1:759-1067(+)